MKVDDFLENVNLVDSFAISDFDVVLKYKNNLIEFCDPNCRFLSITEEEQSTNKDETMRMSDHICEKYMVRVFHKEFHPLLLKCKECKSDN